MLAISVAMSPPGRSVRPTRAAEEHVAAEDQAVTDEHTLPGECPGVCRTSKRHSPTRRPRRA